MIQRISVALETYDNEYGTLMQMASAYGDKLKTAKGLIDDRMDALAEYNAKKKVFTSAQSKEGKDPAKVKTAQEKYQAAKDAFESADLKATRELETIFQDACGEFEECYTKFLRVQSTLFATAAAALGGAELPTSTMQYTVTGSDEAPRKVYKEELKEEKKREKREKKEEKKEEKRKRRGTVATTKANRNDVFEPSEERGSDDEQAPPPSLSTPPMELRSPRTSNQQRSSMAMANVSGGAPPPLPGGRPAPSSPPSSYDAFNAAPGLPPRTDSGTEIVTGLDLIGREPAPNRPAPNGPPPMLPPSYSSSSYEDEAGPPPLPSGRPRPPPSSDGGFGGFSDESFSPRSGGDSFSPRSGGDSFSPRSGGGPPPLPSYNSSNDDSFSPRSGGGPPPLPAYNASNNGGGPPPLPGGRQSFHNDAAPPALPPSRPNRAGSISGSEPPSLPDRSHSGTIHSPGRPSLPPVPLTPSTASNDQPPHQTSSGKLPSPRRGIQVLPPIAPAPGASNAQDSTHGGPPSLPGRNRAPSIPSSNASTNGPPALPSGRAPSSSVSSNNGPPMLPGRNPGSSASSSGGPPKLPASMPSSQFQPSTSAASTQSPPLIIPTEELNKYALIFKREDTSNCGFITGQQAFTLFSRSKLPSIELAQIWELSDQDKDGKLTRDEFIIAMWYINSKLKGHIAAVPKEVHPSLVLKNYSDNKLPGVTA